MRSAAAVAERPPVSTVWKAMSSAPHLGLVLLKVPSEGGSWPIIGRWSTAHGAFCTPPVLGLNETILFPVAWTEIPAYDGNHV